MLIENKIKGVIITMFLGYYIKSTEIKFVSEILNKARTNVRDMAISEYHKLLSLELTELIDNIILNIESRPQGTIFDEGIRRLHKRISYTEYKNIGTEYDLRTSVSLFPDKEKTYILLHCSNPSLVEAFAKTEGIEDYTIQDSGSAVLNELDEEQENRIMKWDEIRKQDMLPMSVMLTTQMTADIDLCEFASPLTRADIRARRAMLTRLLNAYGCEEEIPKTQLMPLLDMSLSSLLKPEITNAISSAKAQLAQTLIPITKDVLLFDPSNPIIEDSTEEDAMEEPISMPDEIFEPEENIDNNSEEDK